MKEFTSKLESNENSLSQYESTLIFKEEEIKNNLDRINILSKTNTELQNNLENYKTNNLILEDLIMDQKMISSNLELKNKKYVKVNMDQFEQIKALNAELVL